MLAEIRRKVLDVDTAITTKGLTKIFGRRKAVDGIDLDLPPAAFLSIFGPNGAGKTSLLRILATLSRPSSGSIEVFGMDMHEHADAIRERIGLISHNSMLYPDLTAEENLLFAAQLYGVEDPQARVLEMLDAVELKHRRLDRVRTFSRGMTQRLSIARALIHDPDLVLLDEPYSGLDPHAVEIFDELIAQVKDDRTFVMVSHDLHKGFSMASHVLVMSQGRSVLYKEKEELEFEEFAQLYGKTVGLGVS